MERKSNLIWVLLGLSGIGLIVYAVVRTRQTGYIEPLPSPQVFITRQVMFDNIERGWDVNEAQRIAQEVGVKILSAQLIGLTPIGILSRDYMRSFRVYTVYGTEDKIKLFEQEGKQPATLI